jgi:hypothetical protein
MTSDPQIEELIAKQAIRDVLSRYCRGLDRMDRAMADSVWSDGATANYVDMYEGTGLGFIDWAWEVHAGMQCHSHQITNVLTLVDGDTAASEAYATVVLWTNPDDEGRQTEITVRGRYLDRWSCRAGRWSIDHRTHVVDTQSLARLRKGPVSGASRRDTQDASFAFLKPG